MKPLTKKLLMRCKDAGYTSVIIGEGEYMYSPGISCSPERDKQRIDHHPAIWRILEELSLQYGCGCEHSHQIDKRELPKLDAGTWELRNGGWVLKEARK